MLRLSVVKSLLSNNDQKLKIDSRERNFQDKLFGYVGGPRKIFSQFGFQGPFLVHWGGFLLKLSQNMSKYWIYGFKSFSFLSRPRGGQMEHPWPWCLPDKNKLGIWHPRDLRPPPLNAGQVSWLDFCATLGVWDAPLQSYKVYKFKENMDYLSRLQYTAFFGSFDIRYHS